jgi:hypothetical protein
MGSWRHPGWPATRRALGWLRLGRCPVCGTTVLLDDEFVRLNGSVLHTECQEHRRAQERLSAS